MGTSILMGSPTRAQAKQGASVVYTEQQRTHFPCVYCLVKFPEVRAMITATIVIDKPTPGRLVELEWPLYYLRGSDRRRENIKRAVSESCGTV